MRDQTDTAEESSAAEVVGTAFDRLPGPLKSLGIPFDAGDIATLHSSNRLIGNLI